MPAPQGLTTTENIDITTREIDFVSRFTRNWQALLDILGITRPIKMQPGTHLTSKYGEVTLADSVGEGEVIPYSQAEVKEKEYATLEVEKRKKGVSIEAIAKYGYDAAVQKTDDAFLYELQNDVMCRFYSYIKTGTLTSVEDTFQMALSMALGRVKNRWQEMQMGITEVVGFCNIIDFHRYIGASMITTQTQYGLNYIKNFLGYSTLFLMSDNEIPQGTVIATPVENIDLYYVDPADSAFAKAGLVYRSDGVTNLIGFHVQGDYNTAVSDSFALLGLTLFSEYLDGIAVITFGDTPVVTPSVTLDKSTANVNVGDTVALTATTVPAGETVTWTSSDNEKATVSNGTVTGVAAGTATITAKITVDGTDYTDTCTVTVAGA